VRLESEKRFGNKGVFIHVLLKELMKLGQVCRDCIDKAKRAGVKLRLAYHIRWKSTYASPDYNRKVSPGLALHAIGCVHRIQLEGKRFGVAPVLVPEFVYGLPESFKQVHNARGINLRSTGIKASTNGEIVAGRVRFLLCLFISEKLQNSYKER
jgi:hypothetical protein